MTPDQMASASIDPTAVSTQTLMIAMASSAAIGLVIGCLLYRRGGSEDDDDESDMDSEDNEKDGSSD